MPNCVLCETLLTAEARSREHVIPASLGGRKRTSMSLCRQCNSATGHEWDAELERQLRAVSLIVFPPDHPCGQKQRRVADAEGNRLLLKGGIRGGAEDPQIRIQKDGDGMDFHISAPSRKRAGQELRRLIKEGVLPADREAEFIGSIQLEEATTRVEFTEDGSVGGPAAWSSTLKSMVSRVRRPVTQPCPVSIAPNPPKLPPGNDVMRSEQAIFDDLATLCGSNGYIHALAVICFQDNIVRFKDALKAEDMAKMYTPSRLIRTEMTALVGLMMRAPITLDLPRPEVVSMYISQSRSLLEELHQAMIAEARTDIDLRTSPESISDPFTRGRFFREPIFYAAESAYSFQYREFAPFKYQSDTEWLQEKRGIDLETGRQVCRQIGEILGERLPQIFSGLHGKPPAEWTLLPGFAFACTELADRMKQPVQLVRTFVEAFTLPNEERNPTFTTLNEFNVATALPFIRKGADEFIMLQSYGVSESFYEAPFYWMLEDLDYRPTALRHRGDFTESLSAERLVRVFGAARVFRNVRIRKSRRRILGEVDVLVLFGDRAIIVQAKSKKLTLEARKGHDRVLKDDFKAAVQDAIDQAAACAKLLGDAAITLENSDGRPVRLRQPLQRIYPVAILSEHYPALALQTRQFLKAESDERIAPAFVTDVFALDTVTEFLVSPLRFLSFLSLRGKFGSSIWANHESVLFAYHLKNNLWLSSDTDLMLVEDNISVELDVAMAVRRDGVPGVETPDGILTRFEGTPFSQIVAQIENEPTPASIDLGLFLLELGEDSVRTIDDNVRRVTYLAAADGKLHDMSLGFNAPSTGLTIHCSHLESRDAERILHRHCRVRKYSQKADTWFGIALRPNGSIQLAAKLTGPWEFDPVMEGLQETLGPPHWVRGRRSSKIGRNAPCPCGSGKKYKRCCLKR